MQNSLPVFTPAVTVFFVLATLRALPAEPMGQSPAQVDFAREVLPILNRHCLECHGPNKQEGGLRLDTREHAFRGGDSGLALAPGKPAESELLRRITLPKNDDAVMPARGALLTPAQIALVRRWIEAGADWPAGLKPQPHWAYVPPVKQVPPAAPNHPAWEQNAIDRFILARLQREKLAPSPPAERAVLLRRLSFDLIGLPPTPAEVEAFEKDDRPGAYERQVERLLASDQYGVRWARPWLDYARYADSHGFQRDDFRDLWPYRDWVVDALNRDLPFDQFTIEQLAGDLLPNSTPQQRIATGFGRSAPTNVEAGSDPEETRVNQVFDRVNTVGMIWLGATLECCQCHDHKYDPFTIRDYYSLFAFFNSTALEADRSNPKVPGSIRFLGPTMTLPGSSGMQRELAERKQTELAQRIAAREKLLQTADPAWEAALTKAQAAAPREHRLEAVDFDSLGGASHSVLEDGSILLSGEAPDRDTYTVTLKLPHAEVRALKLETLTDPSLPGKGPGRGDEQRPNFVLHELTAELLLDGAAKPESLKFAQATADFSQANFSPQGAVDGDPKTAWAINPQFHQPHWAVFELAKPLQGAAGAKLVVQLVQNFGGSRTIGRLRISALTGQLGGAAAPVDLVEILQLTPQDRSPAQQQKLIAYRLEQDAELKALQAERDQAEAKLTAAKGPTTLVMEELPQPRANHIFLRGEFRTPGPAVEPSVPAILPPLPANTTERNRLTLARWLVSRENPLTARVTVNRFWAELFGQGLVSTPEDFGVKGEPPTHPELLDWLAVQFMDNGWSQKQLLKTIVLSQTYQQSSRATPASRLSDDRNLTLARGPRFRLDAEQIRDNALAIAGLLSPKLGGAPIRPYQPDGLWVKVGGQRYDYVVSPGDEQYRRGLFVVWKRGAPYPSFVNFDAGSRLACRVKRPRSNTPLQALTLLNDPVYVEAAGAFARRILKESPAEDDAARLRYAFRLAVAREPRAAEIAVLQTLLTQERGASPAPSAIVPKAKGKKPAAAPAGPFGAVPPGVSAEEFSAWCGVATALLNLDETITKG